MRYSTAAAYAVLAGLTAAAPPAVEQKPKRRRDPISLYSSGTLKRWPAKAPVGSTRKSEARQAHHHLKMRGKGHRP
jgi:hypothetical protein